MVKIREANRSDATCIIDFQLKMALETENLVLTKSVVEYGVKTVFNENSKGAYYVAEVDGTIVGALLTTYEWSDWRNGNILWIQSVYVSNDFRRRGIYQKMYAYIKNKVRDHKLDFKGIRLYVDKTNVIAQKVYKKLGMENQHYEMYEWMI